MCSRRDSLRSSLKALDSCWRHSVSVKQWRRQNERYVKKFFLIYFLYFIFIYNKNLICIFNCNNLDNVKFLYIYIDSNLALDVVGSSQIFFPAQNVERAYKVDKESEAAMWCLQYNQCAGPQKLSKLSLLKMLTKISGPKIQIL